MRLVFISILFVCVSCQNTDDGPASEIGESVVNAVEGNDIGIERPCQISDTDCIRQFLQDHSHCHITNGSVPEPLYRAQSTDQLSRLNYTVTSVHLNYTGLNGRITEFFINRKTDQAVLAVEFQNVGFRSNNSYFIFYRRAQEPVITNDFISVQFMSLVVTAIIPRVNNLQYHKAFHYSFSNDASPVFTFGPNIFSLREPVVEFAYLGFLQNPPVNARELITTQGAFLMANFVQYTLCDFGLHVL